MIEIDYAARVAKGAALLDEQRPGWVDEIDLDTLDIRSTSDCVTAQLSGVADYLTGMRDLGLTPGNEGTYVALGFNTESYHPAEELPEEPPEGYDQEEAYDILNGLWRELITTRREARS